MVYADDFYYKDQVSSILNSTKLKKNTSIFSVNRDKIASNVEASFPYAKANVNIDSFTSVKITLSNRTPLYYFVQESVYYILDEDCKILKVTNDVTEAEKHILLKDVFSASESTLAGQFLNNKYTHICNDLYLALYTNAVVEIDSGEGYEETYLDRGLMCETIDLVEFSQSTELNGKMDKLEMTTSYGVKITIIEPQQNLGYKINMAFSALRKLQQDDRLNSTSFATSGSINVIYTYQQGTTSTICEYRA